MFNIWCKGREGKKSGRKGRSKFGSATDQQEETEKGHGEAEDSGGSRPRYRSSGGMEQLRRDGTGMANQVVC